MKTRKFRRRRCALIFFINAVFVLIIFISSYQHTQHLRRMKELKSIKKLPSSKLRLAIQDDKRPDEAIILYWTTYFGGDPTQDPLWVLSNSTYPKCFDNCRIVLDKDYLGVSDAIVFHSRDMSNSEMPLFHPSNQVWVYLQQESPSYTREDLTEFRNVFNWTMTYRKDSDIYHPYFVTVPLNATDEGNVNVSPPISSNKSANEILQTKTKLVAWIVSNCNTKSKRENHVHQLQSFIPIDIYGSCGDFSCPKTANHGHGCLPNIAKKYKFYLSFENSLCTDYITEKFSNALQYNLVPIVYGGGDYNQVSPPGSFINANDFPNPKALANYLLFLDKNPKMYLKYFQWKSKYKVIVGNGLCRLCGKVVKHKMKPTLKTYENLSEWWHYGKNSVPVCHEPSLELQVEWKFIGFDVFKYIRRWFYKSVLGY